ncbi:ubiquitously-expressed transcript [Elysia marginata]|uniref:Ubiquitously-expressed transcript n=1 Tax=Elysia marginata TaxID=1093978 RepID=A0AAV4E813_9GAST|nr:ubiquitously-expressed transcript [Elysia marginata]
MNMSSSDSKVFEYESFLNERLREDLRLILEQRDKLYGELTEYFQLRATIQKIKEDVKPESLLKTKVDLGCNFYVQANIPDPSTICVAIGYGFFLDMTFDEALAFIQRKTEVLQDKIDCQTRDAGRVKAHIRLVLEGLRELQQIQAQPRSSHKDFLS